MISRRAFAHLTLGAAACVKGSETGSVVPAEAPTSDGASADSYAALAGFCEGVDDPAPGERTGRVQALRTALEQLGASAIVMEAGVDQQYFTGVRWGRSERPLLWTLPREGEPFWVGPAFEALRLEEQTRGEKLLTWEEDRSPYALVHEELGASVGSVAVGEQMRHFVSSSLYSAGLDAPSRADPRALTPAAACRVRKSAGELACLRRASEATKAALSLVFARLREGMSEDELAAEVRSAQRAAGLESVWVLALFGANAAFPHGTGQTRRLQKGDAVLVDTGGRLHGYWSDVTRTTVFGEPSPRLSQAWQVVREAQARALEIIRPGVPAAEVDAVARAVVGEHGFGANYDYFTHRLGHGIGLEVHEHPYLVASNTVPLESGNCMSDEPGIYEPGEYGVRIEDIVHVTEDGAERLGPETEPLAG